MEHEVKYRGYIQSTSTLVVAFFEHPDEFATALATVRQQLRQANVEPDKGCILYRSRCESEDPPRWRVWSQPVPFESLAFAADPWVGLERFRGRPMTGEECRRFLDEKRYDVLELRVSKRDASVPARRS